MKKKEAGSGISEAELEAQALAQEKAAHYKEAIALYKKLLQTNELEKYHQRLGFCYVQRAVLFALKGMLKEAIVMWESHCVHVQAPYQAYEQYLIWLIYTHNTAKITSSFAQLTAEQLDKQYPALANVLGLLMLTEHPELAMLLPQDSALIEHFKTVQAALKSWQAGEQESVNRYLKLLPYRSAFRDLRIVLNAIMQGENDSDKAIILLAKVPENSVYAALAAMVRACFQTGKNLFIAMAQCRYTQYQSISDIKGLSKEQLSFMTQLTQQEKLSDKNRFNLAIKYKSLIGSELTEQFCQALLISYPAGKKLFKKEFGALAGFEENRLLALKYEQENDFYEAEHYWKNCLSILEKQETDNRLKMALIIRHLATKEADEGERIRLLSDSLANDPSNHVCYLHILHYYSRHQTMAADYQQWLAKALAQFPEDVEILVQAMNVATQNKTFKKASQYALKILKTDPLNTFAKQTLLASHLAHARCLIKEKKYSLVDKELKQAEQLSAGKRGAQQINIMRGILYFAYQDKAQGLQFIVDALAVAHSEPVNMQFQAVIEVLRTGLPLATLLCALPPIKECLLSMEHITKLFEQVQRLHTENIESDILFKALEKIKAPLKKSLTHHSIDEAFLLTACQLFENIQHFELLHHCAELGFKQWMKPNWFYYKVYSETNNQPEKCHFKDAMSLQHYHRLATEAGDRQTAIRLEQFLKRYHLAHPQGDMGFLENLLGLTDDKEELSPLDTLFRHLSPSVQLKLDAVLDEVAQQMTPEQLVTEMTQEVDSSVVLGKVMQQPDLLTALMLVKAANKVDMDIGVSVDDVLECFDVKKKNRSFPFPF